MVKIHKISDLDNFTLSYIYFDLTLRSFALFAMVHFGTLTVKHVSVTSVYALPAIVASVLSASNTFLLTK